MENGRRNIVPFQLVRPLDAAAHPAASRDRSRKSRAVLVVDWNRGRGLEIVNFLSRGLKPPEVSLAENLPDLLTAYNKTDPDVIVASLNGPQNASSRRAREEEMGLDLLLALKLFEFSGEVIVFRDQATRLSIEEYCRPFALGSSHFLDSSAPDFLEELHKKVGQGLLRPPQELESARDRELKQVFERLGVVGKSSAMLEIFRQAEKVSRFSEVTVLLTGESGTGKQRLAEAIHRLDEKRKNGPFVTVNCTAIPRDLAESELFGHKRGAFTGAAEERAGYFRMAEGGTILLDEIGDLPVALQPKLHRALEEKKVSPVGVDREVTVDVRVIAATNRNLEALMEAGRFRLDLYQRLSAFSIEMPPLRSRREDLVPLLAFFVKQFKGLCGQEIEGADPRVIEILSRLDFPGNVRQLQNLVLQILSGKEGGTVIEIRDLPENVIRRVAAPASNEREDEVARAFADQLVRKRMSLSEAVEYSEKLLLRLVLSQTGGNRTRAAELLKTTPRTLFNKIQKHHLKISATEGGLRRTKRRQGAGTQT